MSRTFVVINRCAGGLLRGALLDVLRRPRHGFTVLETETSHDLEVAAEQVARRADETRDAVVLAGGDGSAMSGVTALVRVFGARSLPRIAFVPGGTVNTVARNWGYRGRAVAYSERLLDILTDARRARTERRPTLRVEDSESQPRIGFILGAGLVARFFEHYEAGGSRGNLSAARIAAKVFAGSFVGSSFARQVLDPTRCQVTVDEKPATFDRVSLVCASVVRDLGLGMRLLYRAAEREDRFHVVATPLGPRALGPQMPLVLGGRPLIGPRVDALCRTTTLDFGARRDAYVLDGDLFRAERLEVRCGPTLDVVTL